MAYPGHHGGGYAEYICLAEDMAVAIKPENLTFEEAAAIPFGGNTALHFIKQANIQKGQKILIYGAFRQRRYFCGPAGQVSSGQRLREFAVPQTLIW